MSTLQILRIFAMATVLPKSFHPPFLPDKGMKLVRGVTLPETDLSGRPTPFSAEALHDLVVVAVAQK